MSDHVLQINEIVIRSKTKNNVTGINIKLDLSQVTMIKIVFFRSFDSTRCRKGYLKFNLSVQHFWISTFNLQKGKMCWVLVLKKNAMCFCVYTCFFLLMWHWMYKRKEWKRKLICSWQLLACGDWPVACDWEVVRRKTAV